MSKKNSFNDLRIISQSINSAAKIYETNLCNKKVLIISQNKEQKLNFVEVLFSPSNFEHLVGCKEVINDKETTATDFYNRIIKKQIDWNNLVIENNFVKSKVEILPQIMAIDRTANMIGNYNGIGQLKLKSDKVTGNIVGCLGISIAKENPNYYVPISTIKRDIRDISYDNERIVAILKKNCLDIMYDNFTYLKKGFNLYKILDNEDLGKYINKEKIFSNNKFINKIINEYKG